MLMGMAMFNVYDSTERRVKLLTDSRREADELKDKLNRPAPMYCRFVVIVDGSAAAVALDFANK